MSANETSTGAYSPTQTYSTFQCDIPIPNYLMALVVGHIEYKSTGYRTGVITEPEDMDRVYTELEDMEVLFNATEGYMGTYIWGNYTIIILPPSFPMGGMENPLLTFASPTIIVGDKS
jgi:leukotriene-A4 hydrolase